MCLSTVYNKSRQDDQVLMKNVRLIETDNGKITLTDIMESTKTYAGSIAEADLVNGYVILHVKDTESDGSK